MSLLCRLSKSLSWRTVSHDQAVQQIIEIPQLHVDMVFDVPGVQVERVPQVPSWRTVVLPRLHSLRKCSSSSR